MNASAQKFVENYLERKDINFTEFKFQAISVGEENTTHDKQTHMVIIDTKIRV